MKKTLLFTAVMFTLLSSPAFAALSVDDFIPPVQASSEAERAERLKVREPGEVKEVEGEVTEEPAISAKSAQDAVNAWVETNERNCGGRLSRRFRICLHRYCHV